LLFKSLKVLFLAGALLIVAGALATSALTSVTIDRTVSATLNSDNETTVAVRMVCLDNASGVDYTDVCQYDANGVLTMQLHRAISAGGSIGFNRNASFQIGSDAADTRVLAVTNNSSAPVTVNFDSAGIQMISSTGTTLAAAGGAGAAVAAGATVEFYYVLNTPNSTATSLTGTIQIR